MPSTTTTMTTTMMMASNDIPSWHSKEVVGAAATGGAEAPSLPSPAPWSFFVLGEKKDRLFEVFSDMGIVRIKTLTVPNNFVSLSTEQWARLMSVRDEINAVIEDIKCYNPQFPSGYSGHIGDYYYVTVIGDYGRVDIRHFYHPNGNPEYVMHATLNGVSLNFDECAHLLQLVPTTRTSSGVRRIVQQGKTAKIL